MLSERLPKVQASIRLRQRGAVLTKMAALEDCVARWSEAAWRTVSSCYPDAEGVPRVWPWSYDHFQQVMAAPNLDDYEFLRG